MSFKTSLFLAIAYFIFMALTGCQSEDVYYSHGTFTVQEVRKLDDNWSSVTLKDSETGILYPGQVSHCDYMAIATLPASASFVLVVEHRTSWNKTEIQDICPFIEQASQDYKSTVGG